MANKVDDITSSAADCDVTIKHAISDSAIKESIAFKAICEAHTMLKDEGGAETGVDKISGADGTEAIGVGDVFECSVIVTE